MDDELTRMLSSVQFECPTGTAPPPGQVPEELQALQSKLEKLKSKMKDKLSLMQKKMKISSSLPPNTVKLLISTSIGNKSQCAFLLNSGTDVNSRGASGETALCVAAGGGHTDLLPLLLKEGADVNVQDEDGDTPLMYAVMAGKLEFVRVLLENCEGRIDINLKNKAGKTAIECAFKTGNENAVRLLSEKGANFECNDKKDNKYLFKYAVEGKIYLIEFWISHHPHSSSAVNITGKGSRTLTLTAALKGHQDIVKFLSDKGANLDMPDEDGDTPLFCAAQNGFFETVKFLVEHRCDVNHKNKNGRTPIFNAFLNKNLEIIGYMHSKGADLTVKDRKNLSLMHAAISSGSMDLFKFLCQHLPDQTKQLGEVTRDGETCLLMASQTKHYQMFEYLVEQNVDLNHRNRRGVSAMLRAADSGQFEMVQLLAERGADLDLPNRNNETALLCAVREDTARLATYLINSKKCNLSVQNCNGLTLVYCAVKKKNVEILRLLIQSSAPLDVADNSGNTPLIVAVNENCMEAVKLLAECEGVDLGRRNRKGHTPIMVAVNNESLETVRYLADKGCEIDASDKFGSTPLLRAIEKNNIEIVKFLISKDCDVNATDLNGESCLHKASQKGSLKLVALLISAGAELNLADKKGNTPIAAFAAKELWKLMSLPGARKCDVSRKNSAGENAVHQCARADLLDNFVILEEFGCQLDAEDDRGNAPLHVAAKAGSKLVAISLIEAGVPVDLPNKRGNTPVHLACKSGSAKILQRLLEKGAFANVQNDRKQTPLMLACKKGSEKVIGIILAKCDAHDMNVQDGSGKTALHYALESEHWGAAQQLIAKGVDVNCADRDGFTARLLVAKMNKWDSFEFTLQGQEGLQQKTNKSETIAHFAASTTDVENLRAIKMLGIPLTELTTEGESCLTLAAAQGSAQVCEFLIAEGNPVNHCNSKGENAICKAAQNGHWELFKFLASNGGNFLQKDNSGSTGLFYLLDKEKSLNSFAITELLSSSQEKDLADLNSSGFSLCHIAAKIGCVKLLGDLHARGWDLSGKTANGESCITLAARADGSETLRSLLRLNLEQNRHEQKLNQSEELKQTPANEQGQEANGEQQQKSERCVQEQKQEQWWHLEVVRALHISAELGRVDLMNELMESGVNVNAEDAHGNTALIIACQHKQKDFAISLISRDVQPPVEVNRVNRGGLSALSYASRHQMTDCVELLLSLGAKTDVMDSKGFTCLHEAVNGRDSISAAELLIKAGCDVNALTADSESCMSLALKNGSWKLTNFLKIRGAILDSSKIPVSAVINKFLSKGRTDTVLWLLDQGVDVNKSEDGSRHVLFDIIDFGAAELLRLFISKGANIECELSNGVTPFLYTIIKGREDLTHILLESGCNVGKKISTGFDCMCLAVLSKRLYSVKWLLEKLPDHPHNEIKGWTALHLSAHVGHPRIFEILCASGYDLRKKPENGLSPVGYAIARGHQTLVEIAKQFERDFVITERDYFVTISELTRADKPMDHPSVLSAAACGFQNMFEFFLSEGVNFEKVGLPLLIACVNGQQHIVKFFASRGFDVAKYKDPENGRTPLLLAIHSGNLHLISFLLDEIKCEIRSVCNNRNTMIQAAVTANQERIMNYLINQGAARDQPNAEGDTPLLEAALLCHQRMMEILLEHDCDIQRLNNEGRNVVHMAVTKADNLDMVKFLMTKGVRINGKDGRGNTPLMIASYQGHHKVAKFLLDCDQNFAAERNEDGSTPALLAAMMGKHEVLHVLADMGCLTDDVDNDGTTALMVAIQSKSVQAVQKLLDTKQCNLTAVNKNGIGVKEIVMRCRDDAMLRLLREHQVLSEQSETAEAAGGSQALAESMVSESTAAVEVGHRIELIFFTPDRPAEDQQHALYDDAATYELDNVINYQGHISAIPGSSIVSGRNPESVAENSTRSGSAISLGIAHPPRSVADSEQHSIHTGQEVND